MKRKCAATLFVCMLALLQVRSYAQSVQSASDTAKAASIIDNYISFIDFEPILKDSILSVVSYVIDREHPQDTMTIYHWYGKGRQLRIEMWQKGEIQEGFYSNGKKLFRMFRPAVRSWVDLTQDNFYNYTLSHDIRGALYNWRSKGAEVRYAGQYKFDGHSVDRVFVSSPGIFDRYYFFEKETGLLFILTEQDHIFGDAKKTKDAQRVDWRAWHEFTPFCGILLPSIESYQCGQNQIVFIYRHYCFEPYRPDLFTEDYHKM